MVTLDDGQSVDEVINRKKKSKSNTKANQELQSDAKLKSIAAAEEAKQAKDAAAKRVW